MTPAFPSKPWAPDPGTSTRLPHAWFLWSKCGVSPALLHPAHSSLRTRALCVQVGGALTLAHSDSQSLLSGLHSPPRSSMWLLLKNPTFILLCLAGATEATLIAGMSTFGPKFLESQFSLSASEAATLFGENTP